MAIFRDAAVSGRRRLRRSGPGKTGLAAATRRLPPKGSICGCVGFPIDSLGVVDRRAVSTLLPGDPAIALYPRATAIMGIGQRLHLQRRDRRVRSRNLRPVVSLPREGNGSVWLQEDRSRRRPSGWCPAHQRRQQSQRGSHDPLEFVVACAGLLSRLATMSLIHAVEGRL
jgi:hypothetical protein